MGRTLSTRKVSPLPRTIPVFPLPSGAGGSPSGRPRDAPLCRPALRAEAWGAAVLSLSFSPRRGSRAPRTRQGLHCLPDLNGEQPDQVEERVVPLARIELATSA